MLHPIFQLRFGASALGTVILVLAASVLLAQLTGATGEHGEAEEAVVHLVGDGEKPWIVHVRMLRRDRIHVLLPQELLLFDRGHRLCTMASAPNAETTAAGTKQL